MINRRTFLAAAVSAAVLTGCAVGPDYDRPYVPVPKDYRHIQGEEADLGLLKARWWTEYNDPNLDFFVSKAIANNRTLQQTMANVERAAAQLTVARSNLFPQLNYSGDLGKSKASLNIPTGAAMGDKPIKSYEALASASWEIDLWGKIRRQTESARATLRATEAAHRAAISSVIGSVISTYLSILTTEEQYKIAVETAESYHKTYQLFLLRFKHGNVSEMEVAQAWSQWESAMVQIPQIRQNNTELKNSLSVLTGVPVDDFPKFKTLDELNVPAVVAGIPSQLLEERPDVIQAEEQLRAANADIGAAKALYFPSISLSGGLGFSSDQLKELFKGPSKVWQYAGNISGPIFHWGAVTAGVRSAEAQQKALLAAYQLAVSTAFADVDNALSRRQNVIEELRSKRSLVMSLEDYSRLANAQYQGGYTGYFTVLQAEQSLLPQQISLAEVKSRALNSVAQVYQALGGGWIDQALIEEQQAIREIEEAEKLKKQPIKPTTAQPMQKSADGQPAKLDAAGPQ